MMTFVRYRKDVKGVRRAKKVIFPFPIKTLNDMFASVIIGGRQRHTYVGGGAVRYNAIRAEQIEQARKYFHLFRPTIVGADERGRTTRRRINH